MDKEKDEGSGVQHRNGKISRRYNSVVIEEPVYMKRELGLVSGISLIVGTIVGSGIFISPKAVLELTGSVGLSLVVWTGSGLLALLGATCYAELGTLIRKSGGEYAYIMEALGPIPAFLYAWTAVLVMRTASIAIGSLIFAQYTVELLPICGHAEAPIKVVATAAIVLLTAMNSYSVRLTTRVQVVFTIAKLTALSIIIIGGAVQLAQGKTTQFHNSFKGSTSSPSVIALAFYQALWAFDGWNNLTYVTEEIRKPEKNIPRANIAALILVTFINVFANVSYLTAMTSAELLEAPAVALLWGNRVLKGAASILPIFVLISAFGSANGIVFTGGRIVYVAAREGHLPEVLSFIHCRRRTPIPSMIFMSSIAFGMVYVSDIRSLVDFFSFAAWLFYGTAVGTLLVLRYTKRDAKRIIKVPIILPILFVLCSIFLVIAPILESPKLEFLYATLFVAGGLVFYFPFVHFKLVKIDRITVFLQMLLEIVPSRHTPDA